MDFNIFDLGLTRYRETLAIQKDVWQKVKNGALPSSIIVCQHYPVITLGRNAKRENILAEIGQIQKQGIEIIEVDRGGDVTYHGPGQLVFYPIFDLKVFGQDIHLFLRKLEEVVISYLKDYGISSHRLNNLTGVWVENKKIASIGISIRNWITYHGLSINIQHDCLNNFKFIRPCGMDIQTTSLEDALGRKNDMEQAKRNLINRFRQVYLEAEVAL
ncbi:MAG: lipoyl(octanoyl) transferase LipB [Candidatus Omnitrophica bacterium]|nr:lipoyl(octanoyl) transferase LipB [Candidatus Omnitrophota bacterium]MDD5237258.1 lipoyl(octanoyl) transferase LipB [Candidatus Omnitrophota bacterium]MDD5610349.1 lipoyl(octanoyl) transferase LipB [Candidatus Omnitrophota bacterium]